MKEMIFRRCVTVSNTKAFAMRNATHFAKFCISTNQQCSQVNQVTEIDLIQVNPAVPEIQGLKG